MIADCNTSGRSANLSPGISVVIPVYNSEGTLPQLVQRLESALGGAHGNLEVIMINDGSRDKSWSVITQLAQEHRCVRGANLMRNYGQHNAILCGIRMANNEVIVTMDDDLQNPPEEIPKMLEKLAEGYDVVYGTPEKQRHGLWRDASSVIVKLALQSAMGISVARNVSAFRVFRTRLRDAFASYQSPFVSIDVLLTWGTTKFAAVPVRHLVRESGRSGYSFRKLATLAINMVTGYSIFPLQLASIIGFLSTCFGLVILAYVIATYLVKGSGVPGFPFLASIIAIFSGTQLFVMGIIGEYLARVHQRTMERPVYTVGSIVE